jgi:hypothetical protein
VRSAMVNRKAQLERRPVAEAVLALEGRRARGCGAVAGSPPPLPSTSELQDRHVTLFGRPGTGDDPLLVELAGDRPVFDRRKP